jgi:hypothetical protein
MAHLIRFACTGLSRALCSLLPGQNEDVKLREKAVELLNRSRAVSLPDALRNYRQEVISRRGESTGLCEAENMSAYRREPRGTARSSRFGEFHRARVVLADRMSDKVSGPEPPELRECEESFR